MSENPRQQADEGESAFFYRDLERFQRQLQALGAVATTECGFTYVDESKIPAALASAYRLLGRYGYANGLLGGGNE